MHILIDGRCKFTKISSYEPEKLGFTKISCLRKFIVYSRSHEIATQSSHSVDLAGWQAKMASIEIWIPWGNVHKPHHVSECIPYHSMATLVTWFSHDIQSWKQDFALKFLAHNHSTLVWRQRLLMKNIMNRHRNWSMPPESRKKKEEKNSIRVLIKKWMKARIVCIESKSFCGGWLEKYHCSPREHPLEWTLCTQMGT